MTSRDTAKSTCSPASAAGRSRSGSLDGKAPHGPEAAPASPSHPQGALAAWATSGTFGPLFTGSSPSAVLQSSLESRLRARMAVTGSPEYALTWSHWDMPSGPPICRLRALGHRTSGSGFGGWPTPTANDDNKSPEAHLAMKKRMGERAGTGANRTAITSLQVMAKTVLAGWPSLRANKWGAPDSHGKTPEPLAGWPSPMAGTPAQKGYNEAGNTDSSRKTVELLAGWTTPQSHDAQGRGDAERLTRHGTKHGCRNLNDEAALAGWATPRARDFKWQGQTRARKEAGVPPDNLDCQVKEFIFGRSTTSSPAETGKRGALNPAFSLWLMGFSSGWLDCGPPETPSCPSSPPSSSRL